MLICGNALWWLPANVCIALNQHYRPFVCLEHVQCVLPQFESNVIPIIDYREKKKKKEKKREKKRKREKKIEQAMLGHHPHLFSTMATAFYRTILSFKQTEEYAD